MINRICLGTAQFGLDYGRNNKTGKIKESEILEILNYCAEVGIRKIDTAESYGNCEEILGDIISTNSKLIGKFDIISKSEKGGQFQPSAIRVKQSLYGYLVHDFSSFQNDKSFYKMLENRNYGIVEKIGFSVYSLGDLDYLIDNKINFDIIQFPYNIMDYGFAIYMKKLKEMEKEIYVRSVFMQGRVFMENKLEYPKIILEACLYFCFRNKFIDYIIVGIDSLKQLKEIVESVKYMGVIK